MAPAARPRPLLTTLTTVTERIVPTGTDVVDIRVTDRVAVITLTRPERRNALHPDMYPPIRSALREFAEATDVGCIVVTGAGGAFCAGGDVRESRPRNPDGTRPSTAEREAALLADAALVLDLYDHPRLTIAAVNGPAAGAGLSLALACDLRIASASARFLTGWAQLGFSGDFGGAWLLTRLVGPARALEWLASGATIGSDEALSAAVVNRVVADDLFAEAWGDWARVFAHGPQVAIAGMKRNVRDALALPLAEALAPETARMVACSETADHKEAVRAWIDRREPRFGG